MPPIDFSFLQQVWFLTSLSSLSLQLAIILSLWKKQHKGHVKISALGVYIPLVLVQCILLIYSVLDKQEIQWICIYLMNILVWALGAYQYSFCYYTVYSILSCLVLLFESSLILMYHTDYSLSVKDIHLAAPLVACILNVLALVVEINRKPTHEQPFYQLVEGRLVSGETFSSLFSYLTFSWLNPLLTLGQQKPLEEEDLPHLTESDKMAVIVDKWMSFRELTQGDRKSTDHIFSSLLWFTKSFGIFQIIISILKTCLDFATPFFINRVLNFIQSQSPEQVVEHWKEGAQLLGFMFLANIFKELLNSQIELSGRHWGIHLRSILVFEILSKSLRRATVTSAKGLKDDEGDEGYASTGKVVSLMSADVGEIRNFVTDLHRPLVDTPLTVAIGMAGLWSLLGPSALAGLFVVVLSSPASGLALKSIYKIFKKTKILRDKRIQATNEALQGIRIIKYMSWEPQFIKKIREARETELTSRLYGLLGYLGLIVISWGSSILVTFTSFFFYTVVAKHQLDAATAFTCITLLAIVSETLNDISQIVSEVLNIRLVISRIQGFLNEEEIQDKNRLADKVHDDTKLGFEDADFQYYMAKEVTDDKGKMSKKNKKTEEKGTKDETQPLLADAASPEETGVTSFLLHNIQISFPQGELTSIVGPTGAGKTSLLLALLGEMQRLKGEKHLPNPNFMDVKNGQMLHHGIAYVAQTSWLLNATIRDNILFGEPYEPERYMSTLKACALLRDLETLEGGDLTEIGEKGVNLSGGQKQRISLARATYSKAAYVLLDDPLSAVDSPTARHLFDECILGVLKGRTILLVSHSASLVVPKSNFVVVMKNGAVAAAAPFKDILQRPDLVELVTSDYEDTSNTFSNKTDPSATTGKMNVSTEGTKLIDKEGKATGSVQFNTYITYLKACGGWFFIFWIALGFLITTAADFLSSWWIQRWTDNTKAFQDGTFSEGDVQNSPLYYISIFGLISVVELIALMFRFVVQFYGGWQASKTLHHKLLDAVLGAPLRFFEVTPVGRLINRFSKDLADIDSGVMFTVIRFGTLIVSAISNLAIVSFVTPVFLLAIVLAYFYRMIAKRYLSSSRELKRIESVSSSPIYAQFGEVLNGLQTIRAYGCQQRVMDEMNEKVDSNHRAFFYLFAVNRWLYFRNSLLSGSIVFFSGIAIIVSGVSAGWAGLAFNFTTQLTSKMSAMVQTHASMEMSMNSVERVEEYSKIDQEPPAEVPEHQPPPTWPSEGAIEFKDLSIQYDKDLSLVLKNVSFKVKPREKVGIVGRTGAGKSTMSLALFRILPFASGTIEIDGVDINQLGLRDLRSHLTIIAQDATLFAGTIRSNLDPVNEHTDVDIWQALRHSHFTDTLQTNPAQSSSSETIVPASMSLDDRVEENGSNFSQGQRQLLCLARALLRDSKIIFLDEATASVDRDTDSKIQDTIRSQFKKETVLTVAHRLRTVIDYDRILVLDQGHLVENGSPFELLNAKGIFDNMCRESGEYSDLFAIAQREHSRKR